MYEPSMNVVSCDPVRVNVHRLLCQHLGVTIYNSSIINTTHNDIFSPSLSYKQILHSRTFIMTKHPTRDSHEKRVDECTRSRSKETTILFAFDSKEERERAQAYLRSSHRLISASIQPVRQDSRFALSWCTRTVRSQQSSTCSRSP